MYKRKEHDESLIILNDEIPSTVAYEELCYRIEDNEYDDQGTNEVWDALFESTTEIIERFSEADWDKLYKEISKKSNIWKLRFVDLVPDPAEEEHYAKAMLLLLDTNDPELFSLALSFLLNYDFGNYEDLDQLRERAKKLLPETNNTYYKYVINSFLEQNK